MKRFILFLCLALTLCMAGCKNGGGETTDDGIFKGTIKVGHLVALDMAPLFVAKEAGYFKEQGMDVELVFFPNPGDNNAALANGSIQFSTNPFTLPYLGNNAGDPMRIVTGAGGLGIMQVVIQGKYGIGTLEQLKQWILDHPGQKLKIAVLEGDTLEMIVFRMLKNLGLSYDDVEIVRLNDLLAMVDVFRNGEVDILSHIKPYTTDLIVHNGALPLTDNSAIWGVGTPNCTVSVMEDFGKKYPNTVKGYIRAIRKGFRLTVDDPGRAVALLTQGNYYKVDDTVLRYAFDHQPKEVRLDPNEAGMKIAIDDLVSAGHMKAVPKAQVVDLSFLKAVEAEPQTP